MSDEEPGPGGPERSTGDRLREVLTALKKPRILAVLAAIGLVWLGVWTYSSGSEATGAVGTVSTLSAPPTTTHRGRPEGRHKKNKKQKAADAPTTLPAPPPGLAKTPQAFATALFNDWIQRDRADALRVATPDAVSQLFVRHSRHRDQWIAKGCVASGTSTSCTWTSAGRALVLTVRNSTATVPLRVVAAKLTP